MKRFFPLLIALAMWTALWPEAFAADGAGSSGTIMLTAHMNGNQEVPPVATDASGVAAFALHPINGRLYLSAYMTGLGSPITGAHIHDGRPGESGPPIIDLMQYVEGNSIKAYLDISTMPENTIAKMLRGETYLNVHTQNNPNGEIRGQLGIESDMSFHTTLSGAREVPPVATGAYGIGRFTLSPDNSTLNIHVVFRDLSSPLTGAHFHLGAEGENGNVVADLMPLINGNVISGEVNTNTFLQELMDGDIYINIHTQNNPNGEIRGQLGTSYGIRFDAALDASQEVPSPTTPGTGLADIYLSPTLDTLYYDAVFEGLTGPITAAHFHAGARGENGAPVVDLGDNINGNRISGMVTGDALSEQLLSDLLAGNLYLNAHTNDFPAGEVRGQVSGTARTGYIFEMNGGQETPAVTGQAIGGGYVAIDRTTQNAYYALAVDGLTGPITMAHFHRGMPGQSGGAVFDLMPSFTGNTAMGVWSTTATTPFTSELAEAFAEGSIYANVHTDQHQGGEVRGSVVNINSLFDMLVVDPQIDSDILFTAELSGQQEVPPVTTTGRGTAAVHMNADADSLVMTMTVTGLTSAITDAHIHRGRPGENGPPIVPLMQHMDGNSLRLVLTGQQMQSLLALLLLGEAYVNIHTTLHPAGEIRGQLMMEADYGFSSDLSGDQEVPPVTTNGYGHGSAVLGLDERTLSVDFVVQDLSTHITGAHFHRGAPGVSGPVVIDLMPYMSGNRISGTIDIATSLTTSSTVQQFIGDLKAGNIYINIHTENHPAGEIRGQMMMRSGFFMNAMLDGAQEVPPAVTPARGTASFWMTSITSATVHYSVVVDGLTGPITGAHIHQGDVGEPGGVIIDLSAGIQGNRISGQFSLQEFGEFLRLALQGNTYVNVHTPAYPNGEVRGQIFGTQRDGYAFELCGSQVIPAVTTEARGTGVISLDRNNTSARVMLTTEGFPLSSAITSAQLFRGAAGANGSAVFNLTPLLSFGGASGFWTSSDETMPLTEDLATAIRNGDIYLGVGSSLHVGGEIRGQVVKNGICETVSSGVADNTPVTRVVLYPLPADDILYIDLQSTAPVEGTIVLRDVVGRTVITHPVHAGSGVLSLDVSNAASGSYILSIERGREILFAQPIIKQ